MKTIIRYIPNGLVFLRIGLTGFLVWDALDRETGIWFVVCYIVAALSDMLDGMIARRFNVTSPQGSRLDAYADFILYLSILFCIWMVHREVVQSFMIPIVILCITQTTSWLFSLIKFGKLTSYHSYIAKTWAIMLFVAIVALFAFNYAGILFWSIIIIGVISNIEDMIITCVAPRSACDVLTIRDAFALRKEKRKKERV